MELFKNKPTNIRCSKTMIWKLENWRFYNNQDSAIHCLPNIALQLKPRDMKSYCSSNFRRRRRSNKEKTREQKGSLLIAFRKETGVEDGGRSDCEVKTSASLAPISNTSSGATNSPYSGVLPRIWLPELCVPNRVVSPTLERVSPIKSVIFGQEKSLSVTFSHF